MAKIVAFRGDAVDFFARIRQGAICGTPRFPGLPGRFGQIAQLTECIKGVAVICWVQQSVAGKLTFDLNQCFPDGPQNSSADSLVVYLRPARASGA